MPGLSAKPVIATANASSPRICSSPTRSYFDTDVAITPPSTPPTPTADSSSPRPSGPVMKTWTANTGINAPKDGISSSGGTSPSSSIMRATGSVTAKRSPAFISTHTESRTVLPFTR